MKKSPLFATALGLLLVASCSKNGGTGIDQGQAEVQQPPQEEQAPQRIPDEDPLPTKFSEIKDDIVKHDNWKIGRDDAGVFNETPDPDARGEEFDPIELAPDADGKERRTKKRRHFIPRGMIHRYDFTVKEKGYVVMMVAAHVAYDGDRSAAPQMSLFKDDNTVDKQHIALPFQDEPPLDKEPHEFPTGQYAVDGGHGFVVQDLEPGDYIVLVKPRNRDKFGGIQRHDTDIEAPATTFLNVSVCQHCE